ncbi:MAG: DUF1854 domain-containing protein [Clostridia bacterium]|jgi:hypothetical protein|nr:DUF1854 domain-containing protein [Clostridia bacterium]MBP5730899.1 DUF1854 domain-containing protein [Clostridia bacterium]
MDNALTDIVKIEYLQPDKAEFTLKNGYIALKYSWPDEEKEYDRVFLHRCFPNELTEEYLSVLDRDNNEIGVIRSIDEFPEETRDILRGELKRKYHIYTIKAVISVNEKYGYSYWKIKDAEGERDFTVRDTYRSINRIGGDRVTVTDVDGNRFEIPSLEALDRRSRRKIEMYL